MVGSPERIAVIGAGLMGHGIAQVFAMAGHPVALTDVDSRTLESAPSRIAHNLSGFAEYGLVDASAIDEIVARVALIDTLEDVARDADVVFEVAFENLELKRDLFRRLDAVCSPQTILCSNTSVISITQIGLHASHRERILGTHWWNPPFLIPLVEVIRTDETAPSAMDAVVDLLKRAGKRPVRVHMDVPGFVGNRLQHALWREAFDLIDAGICDPATIDEVIRYSFGLRMPVLGPVENADLVGLDLVFAVHDYLFPHLCNSTTPSRTLQERLAEGDLGMKTGRGFLGWTEEETAATRRRLAEHLMTAMAASRKDKEVEAGPVTPSDM
jgi:3-hydroxybutyryl-CoA dehydrogenase